MFGTFRSAYYAIARQSVSYDSRRGGGQVEGRREGEGAAPLGRSAFTSKKNTTHKTYGSDGFRPCGVSSCKMQPVNYGFYDKPRCKRSYLAV